MKILSKPLFLLLFLSVVSVHGQSYSYKVKYGLVQAGTASLVHVVENGILTSTFNIESSPWLSNLWTLSDSVISFYEIDSGRLKTHYKAIHEGNYHRNYTVTFDDSGKAYVNGKAKIIETDNLLDIPSLLYTLSKTKFKDGDTLTYTIWDGRGHGVLSLLVEEPGKQSLFKPFAETGWKLTPLSSTKKSRENQVQLSMLYSKSYPHIPLRIEISTKYGGVLMRLENP